ncbi:lipopolysaccharide kinase InaA family protein [uncultured Roseobacter sp.]|uniref:lipopolysaccharide kinase InaA family protein n=1 Tax=uncultured Roseobacter sp. TaxID=114847 RepID=UPI002621E25C|nr:lipopolysaccharide kinase InaA family protein [uncultured Roseobacter sp.]
MLHVYPSGLQGLPTDTAPDGSIAYWREQDSRNPDLLKAQADFAHPELQPNQKLLKKARQRFIFRHTTETGAVVIKLFPLSFIGSRLRHRKYAYREFVNMIEAQKMGLPTPDAIAFLEKRKTGLVNCSGLIQQSLTDHTDLLRLYRDGAMRYDEVARLGQETILRFYNAGVNHCDLRDENIMLNPETGDLRVIDWQYAVFMEPRAPWLLEHLAAFFIRLAPDEEHATLLEGWLADLHSKGGHPEPLPLFRARVTALIAAHTRMRNRLVLQPIKLEEGAAATS